MKLKTLSDKREIKEILEGHGFNDSFSRHIISLFERKEKETVKKLNKENKKDLDKVISEVLNVESKWTSQEVINVLNRLHFEQSENKCKIFGEELI